MQLAYTPQTMPVSSHLPLKMRPGRWLQVLSHIDPKFGGLSAAVPKLAEELRKQRGIKTNIAAFCGAEERRDPNVGADVAISVWPPNRMDWIYLSGLRRKFQREIESSAGLHIHGLWEISTMAAATGARHAGIPYVLSPHGMLERWALAHKGRKKQIYASLFEHRNVNGAACLHALTIAEAVDCRRFGYSGPVAIIPNGVDADRLADPRLFLDRYPQAKGMRLLLFLGRIHYKKGVDLLLNAWAQLAERYPDVLLVLAGPDSEGTLSQAISLIEDLKLSRRILFTGMLEGPYKWSALVASDFFVLPSYSEGLSVAALEAMSCGLPLIVSEQCNLPQVPEAGAGWQVKTCLENLRGALEEALTSDSAKCADMSSRARKLAESEFSWSGVTERMAQLYDWIEGGSHPKDVEFFEDGR
jgi:glycosyltransferase involved in cell wall biosynthesis